MLLENAFHFFLYVYRPNYQYIQIIISNQAKNSGEYYSKSDTYPNVMIWSINY